MQTARQGKAWYILIQWNLSIVTLCQRLDIIHASHIVEIQIELTANQALFETPFIHVDHNGANPSFISHS